MVKALLDVLYPPVCCGCRSLLTTGEHTICTRCRHELALTNYHLFSFSEAATKFSGRLELAFISCFMYFTKSSIAQKLIHELKYKGQQQIGEMLAFWYANDLKSVETLKKVDFVIPVPLHKRRLRERGYNQVESFAKTLASALGANYEDKLLVRTTYSKTLTKDNRDQRLKTNKTLFALNPKMQPTPGHYLLIDDVLTTGSTLMQCGTVLHGISNIKLSIVTMAMSQ